jgi:hypothetical protein
MSNKSTTHWDRASYHTTYNNGWPNYTITHGDGSWFLTMLDYRNGSSNPRWRQIIKAGGNATTSLVGQTRRVDTKVDGFLKLTDVWGDLSIMQEYTFSGLFQSPEFMYTSSDFTSADNAALKLTYRRIKDQRTSFQGLIFLGELRESIRMIKSPAKALRTGISEYLDTAVKRGRKAPRKSRRKVVAETWLEYSFGWVPLVNDILDGVKAYKKHVNKTFRSRLTSRGSTSSSVIYAAGQRGSNANSIPYVLDKKAIQTQSVQYIVGLEYTCTGADPDVSVFERAGLVFREFVPTLWELTPYSFLVDYFTNVGDILEAGATSTSDVKWVCRTTKSIAKMFTYCAPDTLKTQENRTVSGSPSYSATTATSVNRDGGVLTIPRFELSLPTQPTQWLNMLALSQGVKAARQSFL